MIFITKIEYGGRRILLLDYLRMVQSKIVIVDTGTLGENALHVEVMMGEVVTDSSSGHTKKYCSYTNRALLCIIQLANLRLQQNFNENTRFSQGLNVHLYFLCHTGVATKQNMEAVTANQASLND